MLEPFVGVQFGCFRIAQGLIPILVEKLIETRLLIVGKAKGK